MNASTNHPSRESAARIVAIDLAKDVFELAFADAEHRIVARRDGGSGPDCGAWIAKLGQEPTTKPNTRTQPNRLAETAKKRQ